MQKFKNLTSSTLQSRKNTEEADINYLKKQFRYDIMQYLPKDDQYIGLRPKIITRQSRSYSHNIEQIKNDNNHCCQFSKNSTAHEQKLKNLTKSLQASENTLKQKVELYQKQIQIFRQKQQHFIQQNESNLHKIANLYQQINHNMNEKQSILASLNAIKDNKQLRIKRNSQFHQIINIVMYPQKKLLCSAYTQTNQSAIECMNQQQAKNKYLMGQNSGIAQKNNSNNVYRFNKYQQNYDQVSNVKNAPKKPKLFDMNQMQILTLNKQNSRYLQNKGRKNTASLQKSKPKLQSFQIYPIHDICVNELVSFILSEQGDQFCQQYA